MSDQFTPDSPDEKSRPGGSLDDELQKELEDALGDMNVFDMLDAEEPQARSGQDKIRVGKIIAIHKDDIFVDFGGKTQGLLPAQQFKEQELPKVGDDIEVVVESYDASEGLMMVSLPGSAKEADWDSVQMGQLVEGRVTGHNKGGLELAINGIRAFMPISQIEIFRVEDLHPYVDQKFRCEVIEVNRGEKNLLVSRRAILEREAAEAREKLFETLVEGETVDGVVKNVMPYGAFVDIGGADGLLHVREMSYRRVEDPNEIVKPGQHVKVMILKVDRDERKIALGLKQAMPDPWADVEGKFPVGNSFTGRISKLMDFGAFVELEEGVEGLVPIGEITFERRLKHPSELLAEGQVVRVRVMEIDLPRKRISLSIKQLGDDPWVGSSARWPVGSVVQGVVTRTTDFGAFVEVAGGVEGLIHISELSDQRVRSVEDIVKVGDSIQAKVLSVDEEERRMSLSIKQLSTMPDYTGDMGDAAGPLESSKPKKRKTPLKGGFG